MKIYDFAAKDTEGKEVSMGKYEGKVLLIVNTATGCGFTPQYEGLQELYDKYHEEGFEVLDFPCNQFANQAPGTAKEINNFCKIHYNTDFQRFEKVDVSGKNALPLFDYLKAQKKGMMGGVIKWNFTKFLVDRKGNVVGRYAPTKEPKAIETDIKKALEAK
ncbi:MAG: glutathione peroxidase [Candidatus Saccharimonadales bacterium]